MSGPGWFTKEDMLRDLAVVGGRVGCLDDGFVAIGERPPPPLVLDDDDEEYQLMFGSTPRDVNPFEQEEMTSDLKGITKMIRMVQDYENTADDGKNTNAAEVSDDNVVVISKLNPQAQVFVPHPAPPAQRNEMEETAASLKNTISEAADDNSYEKVKEKNTAIARLLKLYSAPATDKTTKPVKLYTPDFYRQCKASDYNQKNGVDTTKQINIKQKSNQNNACESGPIVNSNVKHTKSLDKAAPIITKNENINNVKIKSNAAEQTKITLLTPDMLKPTERSEVLPSDSEVADSIEKVNNWFENKKSSEPASKPASPVVYLNAVAFKRKDPTTCKSPSEIGDKKISKPSTDKVFVPSKRSQELRQKYENRIKENVNNMNIWDKLEYDLKQKDLEIKARAKAKLANGNGDAPQA